MSTIAEPSVALDCHEQEIWTRICEMFTYLSRVDDMDEEQWRMIKVLSDGFIALMETSNKSQVLNVLYDLLYKYVERSQNYNDII
ncbi:ORF006 [Spodoptera frugiperda granulovirus]|uniref:ORF006 n=1 Tax=Spodoptera frugiperda granulovirus TaxID=307454 RepID=A0A068FTC8_9BBAC|nr:ORF006 [Spodoptera frugiperda granulovirus]AID68443.1 hypothetical protein [Spodoptera frugiperda granulovirus]AJK91667.1 ORF006 [Spodoptera frugiperda granulovirus]AXS01025.1 ORF006 [Spodoptera frugiperda granulovirus]